MSSSRATPLSDHMGKGPTTRARIIDDAIRVASVEGLAGLTIGRLAELTKMSKSGLFAHFESREAVELAVLNEAIARFRDAVVLPALREPRGEPRIRALVEGWYRWGSDTATMPGGCILLHAAAELDDRPGPARELVADAWRQWSDTLRRAAAIAVEEGHFRADLDPLLFALQLQGIILSTHQAQRLLRTPGTAARMNRAVDALIESAHPAPARARRARRSRA
jgi:AcrR family transcriptional regulator